VVKGFAHIHGSQDAHQHAVVGLLVEIQHLSVVVFCELDLDELENLRHEVLLAEVGEAVNENYHQLDEAVDESVVEGRVVQSPFSLWRVEGEFDAGLDHHVAEGKQDLFVGRDFLAELREVVVHLSLLSFLVFDVEQVHPFQKVAFQTSMHLIRPVHRD
jgi:hypothetical protein